MNNDVYSSPLAGRYASKEMLYIFSANNKFHKAVAKRAQSGGKIIIRRQSGGKASVERVVGKAVMANGR